MADQPEQKSGGGLSFQTLGISAAAAVAAATIVPLFWEHGTVIATAMTPVIVALVSEGLRKPVQHVSAVAPRVAPRVARRSGTGAAARRFEPAAAQTRDPERVGARGDGPERFDPLPGHLRDDAPSVREDDPFGLRKASKTPRPRLKIALVTGALAFVIAAGVVTASELAIFGGSVSSDRRTSLFGGQKSSTTTTEEKKADEEATPTATPQDAEATPTPTPTATPDAAATPSPTPSATATPVQPNVTITPAPTP